MFEIFTLKDTADFTNPSLVWRPRWGNPSEFLDETYSTKTDGATVLIVILSKRARAKVTIESL